MQASKVQIGKTYAIYRPDTGTDDKNLVRFRVTAVVQRRHRNTGSPHDYLSTVEGVIVEDHGERADYASDGSKLVVSVTPNAVLGPYEEYAALVERKQRETAAKNKASREQQEAVDELRRLFYALVGEPMPNDGNDYKQLFRSSFGSTVEVKAEGVRALLAALKAKVQP